MRVRATARPARVRFGRIKLRFWKVPRSAPPRARIVFQPAGLHPASRGQPTAADGATPDPLTVARDDSPAARARRTRRKIADQFAEACRNASGQARLRRADEYAVLNRVYSAVRRWVDDGIAEEIKRELRAEAPVAISRTSGLFLLLVRSALPRLDAKRASKWASALEFADGQGIRSKRLRAFLHNSGGIEGAARARAKHLKQVLGRRSGLTRNTDLAEGR